MVPSACTLDKSFPQFRSVQWLGERDPLRISPDDDDTTALAQRYALACVYFATGGDDGSWLDELNFLSGGHECEWHVAAP